MVMLKYRQADEWTSEKLTNQNDCLREKEVPRHGSLAYEGVITYRKADREDFHLMRFLEKQKKIVADRLVSICNNLFLCRNAHGQKLLFLFILKNRKNT